MRFVKSAAGMAFLGVLFCLAIAPAQAACGPDLDQAYIRCLRQQQCMGNCPHDSECNGIKKEALQCYAVRDKARKAEAEKETQENLIKRAQNPGWPCLDQNTCYPQFIPKACFGFVPGARPPYTEQMLSHNTPQCQGQIRELLDAMRRVNALPKLTPEEAQREQRMMPDSPILLTRKKLVDIEARILGEKQPAPSPNQMRRQAAQGEVDLFNANCGPGATAEYRAMCPGVKNLLKRRAKKGDATAQCLINGGTNCVK